jgi:beta-glucosidase
VRTRPGKEVVQLDVGDPQGRLARPIRELKGFAKVSLAPGAADTVTFRLGARDRSYWSTRQQRWVLEAGVFNLAVGRSSRDLRLHVTVEVPAPPIPVRLDVEATLREWLADPAGAAALRQAIGVAASGEPQGILGDDETMPVLGDFPLRTLTALPGLGIDQQVLTALLEHPDVTSR